MDSRLPNNKYLMLALDHRDGFRKIINPDNPSLVSKEIAIEYKKQIINSLKDKFSALLIDEDYGLPAYKSIIPTLTIPYLLPIENTGYKDVDGERVTIVEKTADYLKSQGAYAVKLLVYFCPGSKSSHLQIETAKKVIQDSHDSGLPVFLEIVTYNSESEDKVLESIKAFLKERVIPDVFKIEFPGSEEQCKKVTNILGDIPWILLTRGASYSMFYDQLEIASKNGCQGFLAGRSLWQELLTIKDEKEKETFLKETLPSRFDEIKEIVNSYTQTK
jgi:tagatose-1,6-bisphosphate aldolase